MNTTAGSTHKQTARAFAQTACDRFGDEIEAIHLFGSVARGEERGIHSDVDLLVVLADDADETAVTEAIRVLAYDIELEYGVVLSLVVRTRSALYRDQNRPFFRTVRRNGRALNG